MIGVSEGLHIALHFAVPAAVAGAFLRGNFWRAWGVMTAVMIVDLDHLLADPVFDPDRCSIGFHPLHTVPAIGAWGLLAILPESRITRWAGIGLLIHMGLDALDCLVQAG